MRKIGEQAGGCSDSRPTFSSKALNYRESPFWQRHEAPPGEAVSRDTLRVVMCSTFHSGNMAFTLSFASWKRLFWLQSGMTKTFNEIEFINYGETKSIQIRQKKEK